jgi:hypothetical protein
MTRLRYPIESLRGDYLRAAIGLALTTAPILAIPTRSPGMYVLAGAAGLFALFAVRTWLRQRSSVALDDRGISIFRPSQVTFAWVDIRSVKLSYFSTRSDRTGGWMQLTLKGTDPRRGPGLRTIRVDSALEGFADVVRAAARAAEINRLSISPTTRANFGALGLDVHERPATPPARHATGLPARENG